MRETCCASCGAEGLDIHYNQPPTTLPHATITTTEAKVEKCDHCVMEVKHDIVEAATPKPQDIEEQFMEIHRKLLFDIVSSAYQLGRRYQNTVDYALIRVTLNALDGGDLSDLPRMYYDDMEEMEYLHNRIKELASTI